MTISIWRYSHLTLALSSFVFILLASITGIILAFEPISEQIQPYHSEAFDELTLAETLQVLQDTYPEVITLEVDANQFVLASVITNSGKSLMGYINPKTGQYLGDKIESSKFFQWTTNLHRSLFLKGIGRFFLGLCSFLLCLIAISGTVLILKRQGGFKKFFSKIVNENFEQYWHVVLGRLSLIPIIIITVTGVYLSLLRFDLLPEQKSTHSINFETASASPILDSQDFKLFKSTKLSEVKSIEFPFSNDVEDYFTLKLKDREVIVNQFTGTILSEIKYPLVKFFSNLSLNLHTGKGSIIWSIILAIACVNILFFIYSGFAMTLKRRQSKLKNKYKKDSCKYVILVGSENGSTLPFANTLYEHLLKSGKTVYITELNNYSTFKNAEHLFILTSTYGEGEAPTNANKFLQLLQTTKQPSNLSFSVVGFGSLAYPKFCQFAFDIDQAMQHHFQQKLPVFTINDKSVEAFQQWIKTTQLPIDIPKEKLTLKPKLTNTLSVVSKSNLNDHPDETFTLSLKTKNAKRFTSGDLLAIYPKNDYRERLYSIGKINGHIQLSVKHYQNGLGSNFLYNFQLGDTFKGRIINNAAFHFPKKAPRVIMIANGTGMAPFLGMIQQNKKYVETHLYYGLRQKTSLNLYQDILKESIQIKQLSNMQLAYSQEGEKTYVQDLIERDTEFIGETLKNKGVIMICGSLAMQKAVMQILDIICEQETQQSLSDFKNKGQIKTDCY